MLTLSFTGACLLAGAFLCAALLVTEPTTHLLENTAKAIADTAEAIDEAMDEAKKKLMAALIWGIVQIQVKMKPKEIEKEQEELLKQINDSTCIGSYSIIDNVFNQINNISVNGNNALDDLDETTAEPWPGFEVITGGGGGKEPDKKPDKDPKEIAAKVIAGAGVAAQAASMLNSSTNTQGITNDVTPPFDPNTITRVTDTGTGQVVMDYKDGTRRIFDKKDVPSFIRDSTVRGVSGKRGINGNSTLNTNSIGLSGTWKQVNESMSDFSRAYQKQVTGKEGMVWIQNGVKFDGMKNGILLDAKGKYSQFINKKTGEFYTWFNGKQSLINEAKRQIKASEGAKIEWHFAEKETLEAVQELFMDENITEIELIYEPKK